MRSALRAALAVAAIVASAPARAGAPPCAGAGPWVLVVVPERKALDLDAADVVDRLEAELRARGMEVCTAEPKRAAEPALATVTLGTSGDATSRNAVALTIEVRDAVTAKRVSRDIRLDDVPRDGRAVVVALAADELLRASWAELALENAPRPTPTLTPRAREAVERAVVSERRVAPLALGVRAAAEWWTGGVALYGGDAVGDVRFGRRFALNVAFGARGAPSMDSGHGATSVRALCGRGGAAVTLTPAAWSAAADVAARASVYAVTATGEADAAGAAGSTMTAAAVAIEIGPRFRVPVGTPRLMLALEPMVARSLRSVVATDAGARVGGVDGFAAMISVGVLAEAP